MARHRIASNAQRWVWLAVLLLALGGLGAAGYLVADARPGTPAPRESCARPLRVVTAASFAPVLSALSTSNFARGDCQPLEVTVADGRAAPARADETNADLWIPDDLSWLGGAGSLKLAQAPAGDAGTLLATSPIYMVTDQATAARLTAAGDGWLGLARLVQAGSARLVVRDPAGSGDGLVGAGAAAEAVWLDQDMDASAQWLATAKKSTRTVTGTRPAVPARAGEVGLVPEYELLRNPGLHRGRVVRPGADHTALLRYTWLPSAAALADPGRAAALERLHARLTDANAAAYLRAAHLRPPGGTPPEPAEDPLPPATAAPFTVLEPHHVDHVFATWYVADRQTNLLVVVDVSGSMAARAAGSKTSRIDLVRQGCRSVAGLLPDDSKMGLWEFGSRLDGDRDYRSLLPMTALDRPHRDALAAAVRELTARDTGTGLYDTILSAYASARDSYAGGVPNQVLVLTDGRNESDAGSISAAQLAAQLKRAADPARPVQLSVVTFGTAADAKVIEDATKPVGGYVDNLTTADEVAAVFIHVAAGGLHH